MDAPTNSLGDAPGESPEGRRKRARILIVDDNADIRAMLAGVLDDCGFDSDLADSLSSASDLLRHESFDTVIVDVYLDDNECGLDLLPLVASTQPFTPSIVISGMASVDTVIEALKNGAYDLLRKPFNLSEIERTVRNAVEKKELAEENSRLVQELRNERDQLEDKVEEATRDLASKVSNLSTLNRQLTTIFDMSHATAIEGTPSEILAHILSLLGKVMGFEGGFCVILDLRAEEIGLSYGSNPTCRSISGHIGKALAQHRREIERSINESTHSDRNSVVQQALLNYCPTQWDPRHAFILPLRVPNTLLGFFGLIGIARSERLSVDEERMIALAISSFVAAFEQRNHLHRTRQLESFGELVTEIAHDLRHPMTSLRGMARMLADGWSEENKRARCLNQISVDLKRLESLVSELVNFYKPGDMNMVSVDVAELLGTALQACRLVLEQKHIQVETDFGPEDLRVLGLSPNLIEAFINLISNATQAMDEGGHLSVSATLGLSAEDRKLLADEGKKPEDYLAIAIRDTGRGIGENELEKIFQRFFTTRAEGQGLGLAAVRRIVKKNLGLVHVASEVGEGSTFTVCLPKT